MNQVKEHSTTENLRQSTVPILNSLYTSTLVYMKWTNSQKDKIIEPERNEITQNISSQNMGKIQPDLPKHHKITPSHCFRESFFPSETFRDRHPMLVFQYFCLQNSHWNGPLYCFQHGEGSISCPLFQTLAQSSYEPIPKTQEPLVRFITTMVPFFSFLH